MNGRSRRESDAARLHQPVCVKLLSSDDGYRDGTTHVLVEPLDLPAQLAALVPPPRMHLTRYRAETRLGVLSCQCAALREHEPLFGHGGSAHVAA